MKYLTAPQVSRMLGFTDHSYVYSKAMRQKLGKPVAKRKPRGASRKVWVWLESDVLAYLELNGKHVPVAKAKSKPKANQKLPPKPSPGLRDGAVFGFSLGLLIVLIATLYVVAA